MNWKILVGVFAFLLLISTALAIIQVGPIQWSTGPAPAATPDCFVQSSSDSVPRIYKIIYDSKTVFEVPTSFDCGTLHKDVVIDPTKGTLSVTHIPMAGVKENSVYSVEVWGLTDAEAEAFPSWTPGNADAAKNKDNKREFQFILKQGELGKVSDVTVGGTVYKAHVASIDLAAAIDDSNTKWYPKKDVARCKVKFGCWINNGTAGKCAESTPAGKCDNTTEVDATWNQFTFQKFYDFIKKDSGKKFYLVVENSIDGKGNWTDSKLIPVSIGQAPPVVSGKCKTIIECKALIDKKFIQIFK
jgi:hypothetical protein